MPKYLFHGSYTPEGLKGLLAEGGSKRRQAAEQALKSAGGRFHGGRKRISTHTTAKDECECGDLAF